RHEDLGHRDVVAAAPPEAARVPGVEDGARGGREDHDARHGLAGRVPARRLAVVEHRVAHEPGAVVAAAGERPAAGDPVAARPAAQWARPPGIANTPPRTWFGSRPPSS